MSGLKCNNGEILNEIQSTIIDAVQNWKKTTKELSGVYDLLDDFECNPEANQEMYKLKEEIRSNLATAIRMFGDNKFNFEKFKGTMSDTIKLIESCRKAIDSSNVEKKQ